MITIFQIFELFVPTVMLSLLLTKEETKVEAEKQDYQKTLLMTTF